MLIYPEYPKPITPIQVETAHDIIKTEISFGVRYKRRKSLRKKRMFTLSYEYLNKKEFEILYNFYNQVQETDMEFLFIFPTKTEWKNEYIGKVLDTTTTIRLELPVKEFDYLKVYKNGIEFTDFSIESNDNGRDEIVISTNLVLLGDLLTCDFYGKPALYCEFDETSIGVEMLTAGLHNVSDLKLVEVFK